MGMEECRRARGRPATPVRSKHAHAVQQLPGRKRPDPAEIRELQETAKETLGGKPLTEAERLLKEAHEEYYSNNCPSVAYALLSSASNLDFSGHFILGRAAADLGKDAEAVREFSLSLSLAKSPYDWSYHNRGQSLRQLGRIDEAIKDFEEAIRLGSGADKAAHYAAKGAALFERGRSDEALDALSNGIEAARSSPDDFACSVAEYTEQALMHDRPKSALTATRYLPALRDGSRCTSLVRFHLLLASSLLRVRAPIDSAQVNGGIDAAASKRGWTSWDFDHFDAWLAKATASKESSHQDLTDLYGRIKARLWPVERKPRRCGR